MGKTAFVFAGQGAQYSGMGKDLYDKEPAAKKIFDMADSIKNNTSALCFEGNTEELSITKNTQPAVFAVDLAYAEVLKSKGIKADGAAGFSLGEIPALAFAGALSYEDAFHLVCRRAEHMQKCAEQNKGSMAAILRLDNKTIEDLCKNFSKIYPVNYNCDGQLVVAGAESEMDNFMAQVSEKGGKAIKLAVSGAFHTPFMEDAALKLAEDLSKLKINVPKIPLYSNVTAMPYKDDIPGLVCKQVKRPVRWHETVLNMINDGFDTFIEVGPGKTLSGLIKKISPDVSVHNAGTYEQIKELAGGVLC